MRYYDHNRIRQAAERSQKKKKSALFVASRAKGKNDN